MPIFTRDEILSEIQQYIKESESLAELQEKIVRIISEHLPAYSWVGFYMLDPTDSEVLVLGPFVGEPTTHTRIPVSQGICGAAVLHQETIIVDDVSADPRYLSCSVKTKSEIVVPIYVDGKIMGELDIDSHQLKAFGEEDQHFLEECANLIGHFIASQSG